ncbi:MAG TPA: hypothetical protein VHA06_00085, partial [Candidatus Angelobacter sp.]|nr:hypothetical protein [Candidatus Angelobacter sp.]
LEDEYSGEGEDELEDEYEDESSLEGEGWLGAIGNAVGSLLGEGEDEYEAEGAFEAEDEVSPIRKIYSDAMMEHLGELAFEAETEDEAAEHFLPLIGMAANKLLPVVARAVMPAAKKALPRIARAVTKATPHLTRSIGRVVKTLHRNPQTRHLVKVVPAIARRTVGTIARQAAHGRHITPRTAVKTLTKQARHVLAHPGHRRHALRYHGQLERKFHRYHGKGIPRRYGSGAHQHRHPYGVRYAGVAPGYVGVPNYAAPTYAAHATTGYAPAPATGYVTPGVAYHPAATASAGGQVRYGQCTCAPCPSCGGKAA